MTKNVGGKMEDCREFIDKVPANDNQERKIFVTEDKDLIRRYYKLRNRVFKEEWGYTHEKWSKTDHDDNSQVVVCTIDGEVVGGFRILVSENGELLSEEYEGTEYVYENLLKRAKLPINKRYAEFVDLITDRKFRNIDSIRVMIKTAMDYAKLKNCSYIFAIAPLLYCRLYKKSLTFYGYRDLEVFTDVIWKKVEEYNYSEDCAILAIV